LYCGNSPVFYKRDDKNYAHLEFIEKLNIPVVLGNSLPKIIEAFENIIPNYPTLDTMELVEMDAVYENIKAISNKFSQLFNKQ
jgi:hypothetical protein